MAAYFTFIRQCLFVIVTETELKERNTKLKLKETSGEIYLDGPQRREDYKLKVCDKTWIKKAVEFNISE